MQQGSTCSRSPLKRTPMAPVVGWAAAFLAMAFVLTAAAPAWAVRCAVPDLEKYRSQIRPVPQDQMVPSHQPGDPRTPPDNPQVGDSWLWYTWHLAGPPWPEQKMCTVRGMGQNVYIVVEDSQWGTRVDQADIDACVNAWDNASLGQWPNKGIYQLDTENFGPAPDELDHDPRIYVLYYDFDVSSDGFFWYFDQYPDGTQPYASNECEVLYMNCSEFDPGGNYLISVQAHEFQHMIHWLADEDESIWVNEGMAEMGMWLYGLPDQVVSFPNNPDNNLTNWTGAFADYVKVYLWSLYFYEHFGGQPALLALVAQPANGTFGVQLTLTQLGYTITFAEEVRDWMTANYLDDPTIEGGKYNYEGEDLPAFAAVTKSSYPVPPTNATVNHYAADYVKFINGQPQRLNFDGGDSADWYARVIRYLAGVPLSVEDMPLNSADAGYLDLVGFGTTFDQAVMVVANVSPGGLTTYQYGTQAVPSGVGDAPGLVAGLRLEGIQANPFSVDTALRLVLDRGTLVRASVHDPLGRSVRLLESGPMEAGTHVLRWDGRDESGARVPGGLYLIHVGTGDGRETGQRVILVR